MLSVFSRCLSGMSSGIVAVAVLVSLIGCDTQGANNGTWNDPHPKADASKHIMYSSFNERPKHLDPARSYSSDESRFIDQIYEPPLTYHYLKRPYELEPTTLEAMPSIQYLDENGVEVAENSKKLAYSLYTFTIKPGILYQPHPAFAENAQGEPLYRWQNAKEAARFHSLTDFSENGTRELVAEDYLYGVRRLADPKVLSPVRGLLADYIVGMTEFAETVTQAREALEKEQGKDAWLDLRTIEFSGLEEISRYQFSIKLKGKYPQFKYWLAFHFFAPLPALVEQFYAQPGLQQQNISLNWYPVGTGPFMLTVNDPNSMMVLERNPNYHEVFYPTEGEPEDTTNGLLVDAGKRLPLLDKAVYSLEKEAIPLWTKFMQGYYDRSGIGSDSFDQAVKVGGDGITLSDEMLEKGVRLEKEIVLGTYYMGFNMLDDTLGDTGSKAERERKRKLRQALAIAYDQSEMISIFTNGRGIEGMSPLPAGIFGHVEGQAGINPYVYEWKNNAPQRKNLEVAKKLLAEAGYPNGRDAKTGKPLVLNLDTTSGGSSAVQSWIIKQYAKLNIQLNIRATDYNRFKEKMSLGNAQIFQWGWLADYPDAENFLFLLYGPNSQVKTSSGVNATNYHNAEYDRLFDKMQLMEDSPERQKIIQRMVAIMQHDAPWIGIWHPYSYVLNNAWVSNTKPHGISTALLKFYRVNPQQRAFMQQQWNQPVLWPALVVAVIILLVIIPGVIAWRRYQLNTIKGGK